MEFEQQLSINSGPHDDLDAIDSYFECITACSLNDEGVDCVTKCVEVHLKEES